MATQITSTNLESDIADDIVTRLGANCELAFYDATDTELARCTGGTATKNTGTAPDSVDLTGLADDTNASAGTVSYATLESASGVAEIIRFTAPTTDIGLSGGTFSAGQTVSVSSLAVSVPA